MCGPGGDWRVSNRDLRSTDRSPAGSMAHIRPNQPIRSLALQIGKRDGSKHARPDAGDDRQAGQGLSWGR